MPYLSNRERRVQLSQAVLHVDAETKGELNYVLCEVIQNYLFSQDPKSLGYEELSEAGGALIDAYLEYVRCVLAPYEQRKREENGDVWEINQVLHPKAVEVA